MTHKRDRSLLHGHSAPEWRRLFKAELARMGATGFSVQVPENYGYVRLMEYGNGRGRDLWLEPAYERIRSLPDQTSREALLASWVNAPFAEWYPYYLSTLEVMLEGWVLEDGNYPEGFSEFQSVPFAIEFNPQDLGPAETEYECAFKVGEAEYQVTGKVVWREEDCWAVEIGDGLVVYEELGSPLQVGERFSGRLHLAVDPYFYKEYVHKMEGAPAAIYDWKVESIKVQTAPYVVARPDNPRVFSRDRGRWEWKSVQSTKEKAVEIFDDLYLLRCQRLSGARHQP